MTPDTPPSNRKGAWKRQPRSKRVPPPAVVAPYQNSSSWRRGKFATLVCRCIICTLALTLFLMARAFGEAPDSNILMEVVSGFAAVGLLFFGLFASAETCRGLIRLLTGSRR